MRRIALLMLPLFVTLFLGCDPKVDQRAPRFNETQCPTCVGTGECRYCEGSKECSYCHGEGVRTESTKNYTSEGVNLISYTTECPFCKGKKSCHHCDGTGKCLQCKGSGKVDPSWKGIKEDPRKSK